MVCLVDATATGRPGGTDDLIESASRRNKPVLVIQVAVQNGQPAFREEWHWNHRPGIPAEQQRKFALPALPDALAVIKETLKEVSRCPNLHRTAYRSCLFLV